MSKKIIKKVVALTCAASTVVGALGLGACGKKVPDTEQTLEVLCWDAGYGVKWCSDLLNEFKNEPWVKAKYPNIEVVFTADGDATIITTKIDAGERSNTVDLFFTGGIGKYVGKNASGYEFFSDLTEGVYNQPVPGEERVKVIDKMLPTYVDAMRY